ncbi:acid phosphatase AphA [Vibrio algicola]|uniref:Class B acid phosphatase n=1 Tax=Vibrio algicola TaxID=2662262 RepID=A0A5Q0THD4_9VIBR|nr:acid phosphatase AphA [Vibrio algicola]
MSFFKLKASLITGILALSAMQPSFASTEVHPSFDIHSYTQQAQSNYPDLNWVSVTDIKQSLPNHPINIGLDIDDTMLFSSPVFYYGQQKYSPGSNDYLNNQDFWNEASTGLDRFSIPKKSAVALVTMHLQHGDTVYFVTGRNAVTKGHETVTDTIRSIFPKQYRAQIQPVIFANGLEKETQLKQAKIQLFYGDADQDITSAQHIGIEGIRFLRGAQTTNIPMPHAGKFGEKVLENSNY